MEKSKKDKQPKQFFGIVEDANDPAEMGRVRVRAFGIHSDNLAEVPTDSLPWAITGNTSACVSGVGLSATGFMPGSLVYGVFLDGNECQQPLIIMAIPTTPSNKPTKGKGFNDPSGQYPKYTGASDIHARARGDKGDQSDDYSDSETEGADEETWKLPNDPFEATYPLNQIYNSRTGHTIEVDDSGSGRIKIRHRSGSFVEFLPDGSVVTRGKKDSYTTVQGDGFLQVKGKLNVTITGEAKVRFDSNVQALFKGDVTGVAEKNLSVEVKSDSMINIMGNATLSVTGKCESTVAGSMKATCGDLDVTSLGATKVQSNGALDIQSTGVIAVDGPAVNVLAASFTWNGQTVKTE